MRQLGAYALTDVRASAKQSAKLKEPRMSRNIRGSCLTSGAFCLFHQTKSHHRKQLHIAARRRRHYKERHRQITKARRQNGPKRLLERSTEGQPEKSYQRPSERPTFELRFFAARW